MKPVDINVACPSCGYRSTSKNDLWEHCKEHEGHRPPGSCPICWATDWMDGGCGIPTPQAAPEGCHAELYRRTTTA